MSIPIVGANCTIVGWTDTIPTVVGAHLRHADAERLVGGGIAAIYIEIADQAAAVKAGAPPDWRGPWRCLGLCLDRLIGGDPFRTPMPTLRVKPTGDAR